ncbi:GL14275 [Drosophila persimilis]|uniref:GL14275 n=1 Tax=Drosophila persimilis TaxID=7234 RepID=B4GTG7_DROPE|nr:GL14275 [Drosophila persimilis]
MPVGVQQEQQQEPRPQTQTEPETERHSQNQNQHHNQEKDPVPSTQDRCQDSGPKPELFSMWPKTYCAHAAPIFQFRGFSLSLGLNQ